MNCQAHEAEAIIAQTGRLVGGEFCIGRPINCTGARAVIGNKISLLPDYRDAIEASQRHAPAEGLAKLEDEAEFRQRLVDAGVLFSDDQ